jgi:hypothetical protein
MHVRISKEERKQRRHKHAYCTYIHNRDSMHRATRDRSVQPAGSIRERQGMVCHSLPIAAHLATTRIVVRCLAVLQGTLHELHYMSYNIDGRRLKEKLRATRDRSCYNVLQLPPPQRRCRFRSTTPSSSASSVPTRIDRARSFTASMSRQRKSRCTFRASSPSSLLSRQPLGQRDPPHPSPGGPEALGPVLVQQPIRRDDDAEEDLEVGEGAVAGILLHRDVDPLALADFEEACLLMAAKSRRAMMRLLSSR